MREENQARELSKLHSTSARPGGARTAQLRPPEARVPPPALCPLSFWRAPSHSQVQSGWLGFGKYTWESGCCQLSAAELPVPRATSRPGWSAALWSSPAAAGPRLLDSITRLPFP